MIIEFSIFLGIIIISLLLAKLVIYILTKKIAKLAKKTKTELDDLLIVSLKRPLFLIIFGVGIYIAIGQLPLPDKLIIFFKEAFFVFTVLAGVYLILSLCQAVLNWYAKEVAPKTKSKFDDQFIPLLRKLLKVVIIMIAALIIMEHFKYDIKALVTTLGVASLAIALAVQETLGNVIAGLGIIVDRPFQIGDRIQIPSGEVGDVYEIGLRSVKVLTLDHTMVVVPNAEIAKNRIINLSYPDPKLKLKIPIGVAYGSDLKKVKNILLGIARTLPEILNKPEPKVYFRKFNDFSLDFLLICWIDSYTNKFAITDDINMAINQKFIEQNINIPFPIRQLVGEVEVKKRNV
ncbi:MAG: mechanosensitive ion channel [Candidatus Omnitrophica bacterium]|nr:mechanosensitive ion channel [Candidatus Omnitrophota bacterium]